MSDYRPPRKPRQPDPFLGGAMMAAGALIVALFGTCTVVTLGNASPSEGWAWAMVVWALFTLGGVILIRAGWRTLRGDRDKGGADGG